MVTSTKGQVSDSLVSDHEEADTRMLLHIQDAGKKGYKRIFVHCRDTDVIALLVAFYGQLGVAEIWVCAGTQLKRKYIPFKRYITVYNLVHVLISWHFTH